jgi:hypothetical protein
VPLEQVTTAADVRDLRRANEERYFQANRALATLDVLAGHAERNFLDRELVMQEWAELFALIGGPARLFAEVRAAELGMRGLPWNHLLKFANEAAQWLERPRRSTWRKWS